MKSFKFPKITTNIFLILLTGFASRLLMANFGTLYLDHNTFIAWSNNLVNIGFARFYDSWSDYLPGYLYILWLLGKIREVVQIDSVILYKLPAILADILTGYFIYKIVKKEKGENWGLVSSCLYVFNPAIFGNSSLWGQVDSLTALFSLLAVYFLQTNFGFSAVFLAFGALIKPQAGFIAVLIFFLMISRKWRLEKIFTYIAISASLFIAGFIPFADGKNLPVFILARLSQTANQYPYTSVNAFNLWGVVGMWKPDNLGIVPLQIVGILLFLATTIVTILNKKKEEKLFDYRLLGIVLLSSFVFLTRMHERHLLPALAPIAISLAYLPTLIIPYLGLSLVYVLNLRYAFVWITQNFKAIFTTEIASAISLLSVVFLFLTIFPISKKIFAKLKNILDKENREEKEFFFPKVGFSLTAKKTKLILLAILTFAFVSRTAFLSSPPKEYFDEVYHAFTARTLLHNDPKAWEWWNTPPEGFAYEWTHPPLAKLAMWTSMKILGENSFAWRLPEAIAGTIIVLLVYLLAKEIFKDEAAALLSAGVFSLDGLALVMSRIGMNDSYFLVFALGAIYFFIKKKGRYNTFLSALFLGLAASSKWTTMWVLPVLAVSHFVFKRKGKEIFPSPVLSYAWFLVLPIAVYLLSYLPFFLMGHTWGQFIEVQKQMWWYHTNLKATHPYTSNPLSWPFLIRPIWLYTGGVVNNMVANIYAFGNPFIFWSGVVAVFTVLYETLIAKNKRLGFVVFSYFTLFLPWALSPRIMFLYHYLPAVPFLALATGFSLRKYPKYIVVYGALGLIFFVYFFPHWTGIKIPVWLDNSYYWFNSWR